jgi:hypothetical protein
MLQFIPTEVLWSILNHLEYQDLDVLLQIDPLALAVRHHVQAHYPFHYKITSLLRLFESLTPTERQHQETKALSLQILQLICEQVETSPKFEHRLKFTELLDIVQQLVVQRVLSTNLKSGLEHDYANLCLQVREFYLHTPSIRALHDPVKYHLFIFFFLLLISQKKKKRNIGDAVQSTLWHLFYQETTLGFGDCTVQRRWI